MLLTKENISEKNLEIAFNTDGGFSFEDNDEVRKAVNKKARTIIATLHAEKLGVSLDEFLNNREHYSNILASGYGNS